MDPTDADLMKALEKKLGEINGPCHFPSAVDANASHAMAREALKECAV